jgi:hypothetical protein
MIFGPERLITDLGALGYAAEQRNLNGGGIFIVIACYEIAAGRFAGRKIDLSLQATPDFPRSVHSSIHVRAQPQLFEKTDTVPDVRNIVDSPLGPEWRYWSVNFGWNGQERTARRLMSQINTIFERA